MTFKGKLQILCRLLLWGWYKSAMKYDHLFVWHRQCWGKKARGKRKEEKARVVNMANIYLEWTRDGRSISMFMVVGVDKSVEYTQSWISICFIPFLLSNKKTNSSQHKWDFHYYSKLIENQLSTNQFPMFQWTSGHHDKDGRVKRNTKESSD